MCLTYLFTELFACTYVHVHMYKSLFGQLLLDFKAVCNVTIGKYYILLASYLLFYGCYSPTVYLLKIRHFKKNFISGLPNNSPG